MHVCMIHIYVILIYWPWYMYPWCIYLWCGWNFVTDGRTDGRTDGQGDSRSWMVRSILLHFALHCTLGCTAYNVALGVAHCIALRCTARCREYLRRWTQFWWWDTTLIAHADVFTNASHPFTHPCATNHWSGRPLFSSPTPQCHNSDSKSVQHHQGNSRNRWQWHPNVKSNHTQRNNTEEGTTLWTGI